MSSTIQPSPASPSQGYTWAVAQNHPTTDARSVGGRGEGSFLVRNHASTDTRSVGSCSFDIRLNLALLNLKPRSAGNNTDSTDTSPVGVATNAQIKYVTNGRF